MAVLRESRPVQSGGVQDTRKYVTPQVSKAVVEPDYVRQVGSGDSWKTGLLDNLLGVATKIGGNIIDNKLSDAYLKGSAQAAIGKSEADLETDPFTSQWTVTGYRDNMGRLEQASQDAELARDMTWLREKPPEVMAQYLAEKRDKLLPVLQGMSGDMRMKMIPMMALRDQAAVSAHKVEHQKHIWDVKGKAFTVPISSGITRLTALRASGSPADAEDYVNQTKSVMGSIVDMYTSQDLPRAQKEVLVQEAVELALTQKHVGLYNALRDAVVPDAVDKHGNLISTSGQTLLQSLPVPTQEKLAKQFHTAWEADKVIGNQQIHDNISIMESEIKSDAGHITKWPIERVMSLLDQGTRVGLSQDKRSSIIREWHDAQYKQQGSLVDAQAGLTNNTNHIFGSNGKGISETNKAVYKSLAPLPLNEQVDKLVTAVSVYGNVELAKGVGERMQGSIMALSAPDGKLTPEHAENLAMFHKTLDTLENQPNAMQTVLEGMNPDAQLRLQRLRALHRGGVTGAEAVTKMLEVEKRHASLSTQEKAVLAQAATKADNTYLEGIGGQGLFSRIGTRIASLWSRDSEMRAKIEGRGIVPDAPDSQRAIAKADFLSMYRGEVEVEARELALRGLNGAEDSEARMTTAAANVMQRVVKTGPDAVLIVPRGTTPQKYFGVPTGVPIENIDKAVADYLKPQVEGGFVKTVVTPRGIQWTEYDKNYTQIPGRSGVLDPAKLRPAIEAVQEPNRRMIQETLGEGVKYSAGGIMFNYNGVNTAGAGEKDMLAFRNSIIKHEGVKNKPYKDLSGKLDKQGNPIMTVGVGVSSHNEAYPTQFMRPDGTVSNEGIAESFKKATNWAANEAVRMQRTIGIDNSAAFRLFAEFTYQGKGNFEQFASTLKSRDQAQALAALKQTTAYKMSQPERQKHYEKLTIEAMRG